MGQVPESQNLSIMITDIQGFSQFASEASREDLMALIKTHAELLTPAIHFFKGRIIKSMGDSFLSTFSSATDAAICAIAIRLITSEYNKFQKDEKLRLSIRIIINSGDVSVTDNDIFGEPVNIAARMEKLSHFEEGGIGISESTYLLMNRQEIIATEVGEFQFKGVGDKVKVYSVELEKQKLENLPTKLLKLVEGISKGKSLKKLLEVRAHKTRVMPWVAAMAALTVGIGGTALYFKREKQNIKTSVFALSDAPTTEIKTARDLIQLLMESDKNRDKEITKEEFIGSAEAFKSIDANNNGILERPEIKARIQSLRGSLPNLGPRNRPPLDDE